MASLAVSDAIREHLTANWTACPIAFENERFTPPATDDGSPLPYVVQELSGTVYAQESIGAYPQSANRWDEEGILWLHVFVAAGSGVSTVRAYARQLADLFRGATLLSDSLEFRDASIGMGERGDE